MDSGVSALMFQKSSKLTLLAVAQLLNEIIERNIQDLWKKKQLYKAIFYHNNEYLFNELITDTKEYINSNCTNNNYIEKYKDISTNTNFFFKKTIYQVKKNG